MIFAIFVIFSIYFVVFCAIGYTISPSSHLEWGQCILWPIIGTIRVTKTLVQVVEWLTKNFLKSIYTALKYEVKNGLD